MSNNEFQAEAHSYVERRELVKKIGEEIDRLRNELSKANDGLLEMHHKLTKRVGANIQQKACVIGMKILVVRHVGPNNLAGIDVLDNEAT